MKSDDQIRQETIETQQACAHEPKPVTGFPFIKCCGKCGKILSRNEADVIDMKRKAEVESASSQ